MPKIKDKFKLEVIKNWEEYFDNYVDVSNTLIIADKDKLKFLQDKFQTLYTQVIDEREG
tara:strand:+ start:1046 stop:1222 length:177 start_codon:yes stop_codon:yes gene_type:complete